MVATGYSTSEESDCQLLDVTDAENICLDLPPYPVPMYTGTGGIVSGVPMICGGDPLDPSGGYFHSDCYIFNITSYSWSHLTNMNVERSGMASVALDGALWVAGGYTSNGGSEDDSTEFVYLNGTVLPGPTLPSARDDHCMVTLHDGRIMIMGSDGGTTDQKNTIIYDPISGNFSNVPSLLFDRKRSGCALLYSVKHDNRPIVMAAGGSNSYTAEVFDYSLAGTEWEQSKQMIYLQSFNF